MAAVGFGGDLSIQWYSSGQVQGEIMFGGPVLRFMVSFPFDEFIQ